MAVAKALGLADGEETLEDLGDKAIQAAGAGIIPASFEEYSDYVHAVEQFEVDPEKSKEISQEDKIGKSIELLSRYAGEKCGIEPDTMVGLMNNIARSPQISSFFDECSDMLANAIKENPMFAGSLDRYLSGQERNEGRMDDVENKLTEMGKEAHPEMSDFEIVKIVDQLRQK